MPEGVLPASRSTETIEVGAGGLDVAAIRAVARDGAPVTLAAAARERMAAAAAALDHAARSSVAIYGVTTGLGSRVTEPVAIASHDDLVPGSEYARRTIRGRAAAVGDPLSRELTRAALVVRLAGLAAGGSGASPALADVLAALLNAGVHPRIPRSGSIGASDLCLMAHVGLVCIGEGEAELGGEWLAGETALRHAGLAPVTLGPRDGLAICSSSAVSVGAAALALGDARDALRGAQISAALSLEGFRANLSPLDPRVVAARPAPGQAWASAGLRALLHGSALTTPGAARRLQDPLSFRCAGQLHGALATALGWLDEALVPELTGAADNPLVLLDDGEVVSTGNFQVSALALALDAAAVGIAQVAHAIAERTARLADPRLSGLGRRLIPEPDGDATRSGVGPVAKTAHALVLEIRHAAAPLAIHSAVTADGTEDDSTGAAQAALRVGDQLARLRLLVALELLVAVQAIDLAGVVDGLGAGTAAAHASVRELVAPLGEDRPLGPEIERLERALVSDGRLVARVGEALSGAAP